MSTLAHPLPADRRIPLWLAVSYTGFVEVLTVLLFLPAHLLLARICPLPSDTQTP